MIYAVIYLDDNTADRYYDLYMLCGSCVGIIKCENYPPIIKVIIL